MALAVNGTSFILIGLFIAAITSGGCAGRSILFIGGLLYSDPSPSDQDHTTPRTSPSSLPPLLPHEDYLGCYGDSKELRALPYSLMVSDNMTVANCQHRAQERGFRLYGLEAGRECWGGNDLDRATSLGSSLSCDRPCSGNDHHECGGEPLAILVYMMPASSSLPAKPRLPLRPSPLATPRASYPSGGPAEPMYTASPPPAYTAPPPPAYMASPSAPAYTASPPPAYRASPPPAYTAQPPPTYTASPPPTYTAPPPPAYMASPPTPAYTASPPLPVYASPPLPPAVNGFLLPERLRPESAYFDASSGVSRFAVPDYEEGIVLLWKDVFVSRRPGNLLFFTGRCRLVPEKELLNHGSSAIRFDGVSCGSVMDGPLPNWDTSATGAFTAVWIGRFTDYTAGEQTVMTLSRTPWDYDRELYWTNQQAFAYSHATGFSFDVSIPSPPSSAHNQWMIQVLSRAQLDVHSGYTKTSYYSYGGSDAVSTLELLGTGGPLDPDHFAIGLDYRDADKALDGDIAVVLMYNRALSTDEVLDLINFYRPRFGWQEPNDI